MAKPGWISREKLIKLLGEEGAGRLISVFGGGGRVLVPALGTDAFARFAAKLDDEIAADKFCAEFAGLLIQLPARLVPFDEQIVRLHRQMVTPTEIQRRLGCAARYVYWVLSRE